jgi:hypothetical protein
MKKLIFTITAGLFLLVSCSKDENNNTGGNNGSGGTGKYTCDEVYEIMETKVDETHYDGIIDSLDPYGPNGIIQRRIRYNAGLKHYKFHAPNCFAQGSHEFKNFDDFLTYHLEMDSIIATNEERLFLAKKYDERSALVQANYKLRDSFYKRHSVYHFNPHR